MVPTPSLYTFLAQIMRVELALGSLLCIRAFLVILQGCIGISEQSIWIGLIENK